VIVLNIENHTVMDCGFDRLPCDKREEGDHSYKSSRNIAKLKKREKCAIKQHARDVEKQLGLDVECILKAL
jgi:hypothetical protein